MCTIKKLPSVTDYHSLIHNLCIWHCTECTQCTYCTLYTVLFILSSVKRMHHTIHTVHTVHNVHTLHTIHIVQNVHIYTVKFTLYFLQCDSGHHMQTLYQGLVPCLRNWPHISAPVSSIWQCIVMCALCCVQMC